MTRIELEKLLSAYMDGELSTQDMKKVEAFVQTDAQAKSILDDYLSVRQAIQYETKAMQYKAPAGFASGVLAAIDATIVTTQQPSKMFKSTQNTRYTRDETVSRWRNPRVFVYPLIILLCALLIGVFYRTDTSDTTPLIAQNVPDYGLLSISSHPSAEQQGETITPAPLAIGGGTLSPTEISVPPKRMDLKLSCQAENASSAMTLFTRVFAKYEVPWTKSTSRTNTAIYEVTVTPDTLRKILEDFQANSIEITGDTENLRAEEPIKVFFQVE